MNDKINKAIKILNDNYKKVNNLTMWDFNLFMDKEFGKNKLTRRYGYELLVPLNTWNLSDEDMEFISEEISDPNDIHEIEFCEMYEMLSQKRGGGYYEDLIFDDDIIIGLEDRALTFLYKEYLDNL